MIKINNLKLSYGKETILEHINIEIKEPGLYFICGESGSGKSSLLNILSLMENRYEGEFYFDDKDVSLMNEKEKTEARFNKITYLFQIPKLIENESIITNFEIALGRKITKDEEKEFLKKIHLKNGKKKICVLSGGEKQRVNIMMGILRNTPLILGDEITSGLDEKNKIIILEMLKEEAKNKIIILVSHDEQIVSKYAKEIRRIEDGTLYDISRKRRKIKEEEKEVKNNILPLKYAFKHVFSIVSSKKIRTIVTAFSSLIAFVCLGICLTLTSTLKNSIMSSLGNIVKENQIVMEQKEDSFLIDDSLSLQKEDIKKIYEKYNKEISYLGVNYLTNVDNMFEDTNYFAFIINDNYKNIMDLNLYDINDFGTILEEEKDLFYLSKKSLQEDEIVLSLSHGEIGRLTDELGYEYKDDSSLLKALIDAPVEIKMFASNEEWEYDLEYTFYLVGYYVNDERRIYHTDSLWSEYVYEEIMQLESSLNLSEDDYYPWTLKKEYYLFAKEKNGMKLLESFLENSNLNDYVVKTLKKEYGYGFSFEYAHNNFLKINECNNLVDSYSFLGSYIPCSSYGYNALGDVLMAGFTYPTFISKDYELLEEFINMNSYSDENLGVYQSTILSMTNKDILSLSILDSTKSNYSQFKIDTNTNYEDINSIIVSEGFLKRLGISKDSLTTPLFIMYLKDIEYANGKYRNEFEIVKIRINNVIEDEEVAIYQHYLWPITFLMMNFEMKNIGVDKILINYDGNELENDLKILNEKYQKYTFSAPYLEYSKNIEEIEKYLVSGLTLFSSFCLFSTLLMLIVSSNLFVSELKKEIGIYSLYGYEKNSIKRLYKIFSYFLSLYSFFLSSISLITIFIVLGKEESLIQIDSMKSLVFPLYVMFITSLLIGFISSRASTYRVFKENPLVQLQEK